MLIEAAKVSTNLVMFIVEASLLSFLMAEAAIAALSRCKAL